MVVSSLLEMCSSFVAKKSLLFQITTVLSYQLTEKTVYCLLSNLPINRALHLDKEQNNFKYMDDFWILIINKCKSRNFVFQAKLECSSDPFHCDIFEKLSESHILYGNRQKLLNLLFLEALDKYYYSMKKSSKGIPSFPLHDALDSNTANLSDWSWLVLLSENISSFTFFPRHANVLYCHHILLKNIAKHTSYVDLKLDSTLGTNSIVFRVFYKVLSLMLAENFIKKVSFCKLYSTARYVPLLQLCFGILDLAILDIDDFRMKLKEDNTLTPDNDIWDHALGESAVVSEKECSDYADTVYCNFVQNYSLPEDLLHRNSINSLNVVSEIELDLDGLHTGNFEIELLVACVSNAKNIAKLSISSSHILPHESRNFIETLLLNAIDQSILTANSKLKALKLGSFELSAARLNKICSSLCSVCDERKEPFESLVFLNCFFTESSSHNPISCKETIVKTLKIEKCIFNSDEAYESYQDFFHCINPLNYAVVGYCYEKSAELPINLPLLYSTFQRFNAQKPCLVKRIAFTLPNNEISLDKRIGQALLGVELQSFVVLYYSPCNVLPVVLSTIEQHTKCVTILQKSYGNVHPIYSKEDHLSQM